jgi:hypothetical protein
VPGEERATLALFRRGFAVVPHVEIHDQLPASLEHVDQRDSALRPDERGRSVHLNHRQPPPRGGNLVALKGVRLLQHEQPVEFDLPGSPVDDFGQWVGSALCRHL